MTGAGRAPGAEAASVAGVRGAAIVVLAAAAAACGRSKDASPQRFDGGPPPRRVIEPPPRDVRALPPHAITAGGVGPYKLRIPLTEIMKLLPSGPRMALLQIPGIVDYAAARDEGLLIGGERQGDASFIAVLREGIARTAGGTGVGASEAAMITALGPPIEDPRVARDPNLWVGAGLPGARFVLQGGRVLGVVLTASPATPDPALVAPGAAPVVVAPVDAGAGPPPSPASACTRTPPPGTAYAGVIPSGLRFVGACLGAADGLAVTGDVVIVAARASGETRARRIAVADVRGLRWAAPVRVENDRDEVIVVSEDRVGGARIYTVVALRVDGGRLTRVADAEVYRLDEQSAAWLGASLDDLALRLEVTSDGDALIVGGVLVHAHGTQAETLAPLQPVTVRRRRVVSDGAERGRTDADAGGDAAAATAPVDAGVDGP